MASYGKRKFAGSTSFRPRSRPRSSRVSTRRLVAKKRYKRRLRSTRSRKYSLPRSIIQYSRLPKTCLASFQVTYVIQASAFNKYYIRSNFLQTSPGGTGANVALTGEGSIPQAQVPKAYDRIAGMYKECRIYKSTARCTIRNLDDESGTIHLFGYVYDGKTSHQEPTQTGGVFRNTIPGSKHRACNSGINSDKNVKSITTMFKERYMTPEERVVNEYSINATTHNSNYQHRFMVIPEVLTASTKAHTLTVTVTYFCRFTKPVQLASDFDVTVITAPTGV